ncbi:hypothetical protein HY636_00290 [Candidatus Woesearchaeota archaeon]|nr:hypothetical protein [Candidatus Woesearchaeota archaeon]
MNQNIIPTTIKDNSIISITTKDNSNKNITKTLTKDNLNQNVKAVQIKDNPNQNIKLITTKDNSITFFNEQYKETYHSVSGAVEEAQKKFSDACKIKEFAKLHDEINILDVCFGLGYNTAVAIDNILAVNPNCKINIVGLENDINILNKLNELTPPIVHYDLIQKLVQPQNQQKNEFTLHEKNINLKIIIGDARETIKILNRAELITIINKLANQNNAKNIQFNFCFFDPFSPKTCPELWTKEFFQEVYAVMTNNGVLATYSCARIVRENMKTAGFIVKDGPIVGRRGPGTIGIK